MAEVKKQFSTGECLSYFAALRNPEAFDSLNPKNQGHLVALDQLLSKNAQDIDNPLPMHVAQLKSMIGTPPPKTKAAEVLASIDNVAAQLPTIVNEGITLEKENSALIQEFQQLTEFGKELDRGQLEILLDKATRFRANKVDAFTSKKESFKEQLLEPVIKKTEEATSKKVVLEVPEKGDLAKPAVPAQAQAAAAKPAASAPAAPAAAPAQKKS